MAQVLCDDIRSGTMPREFLQDRKKTRLQDANPEGHGGITETLLRSGFDQQRVLDLFNSFFGAAVANNARFTHSDLRSSTAD